MKWQSWDPSKTTETSLDRTDEDGERLPQRRTTRKQWQENAFTNLTEVLTEVPRNPIELTGEPVTERQEEIHPQSLPTKDTTRRQAAQSAWEPHRDTRQDVEKVLTVWSSSRQRNTSIRLLERRERRRSIRCSRQQRELMRFTLRYTRSCRSCMLRWRWMSVSEDAMKAQPDVEIGTESVQRGTKRASSTWEDCADKINMEACLNTTGKYRRCDANAGGSCRSQIRTHTVARVRSVQVASQIQKVIHEDSRQHENVQRSQEKQSPAQELWYKSAPMQCVYPSTTRAPHAHERRG